MTTVSSRLRRLSVRDKLLQRKGGSYLYFLTNNSVEVNFKELLMNLLKLLELVGRQVFDETLT